MKKRMNRKICRLISVSAAVMIMIATLAGCGDSNSSDKYAGESSSDSFAAAESAAMGDYAYDDYDYAETTEMEEAEEGFDNGAESKEVEVTEGGAKTNRKLIRTVNMNIETYDFDAVTATVSSRVTALGGYIESSSVDGSSTSNGRSANYTLRIPAPQADSFIATIGENSNITHQSESMEDVTLKYVDNKSRKESLQVEYDRLEELLKEADDIEELIYIENRLSEVRYEIESIEAQLRSYDNLVDYTTIYLYIQEVIEYTEPEPVDFSVGARISRGFKEAVENVIEFLGDLLVFIVTALPYLVVLAVFALVIFLIVKLCMAASRKHRLKHPKQMPAPVQMNGPVSSYVAQPGAPTAGPVQTPGAPTVGPVQTPETPVSGTDQNKNE